MPPGETDPLLPRYEDESPPQHRIRQKLRTYQKLYALADGFMPSTDQVVAHLRAVLASDVLSHRNKDIGAVGRQIILDCRHWLQALIDFLREKNGDDQLQQFLWYLARSRASLDPSKTKLARQASSVKPHTDTKAGTDSVLLPCRARHWR